ncbi:hypothetical protein ACQPVP_00860 [Clostridium nigeriense]|uniref:hypothetical protein n=1 Tax=Clostridium nigeriense TaxID=1805470 RepID=UPI003D343956
MAKSNNKKKRSDGTIPMKNKNVAAPINSSNISTSFYSYPNKNEVAKTSKTNQLY